MLGDGGVVGSDIVEGAGVSVAEGDAPGLGAVAAPQAASRTAETARKTARE